jgi:hypothetical protein
MMQGGKEGTDDDLGSMVEAFVHWILECIELAAQGTQGARPNGHMNIILEIFSEFWWSKTYNI